MISREAAVPLVVVRGSAAADLDSTAASLAYAYLLGREGGLPGLAFPYVPISRKDLPLRREVVHLCDKIGLRWENLVFADDIDLAELLAGGEGELVLVDDQGTDLPPELRERLVEVIDHHAAEQPVRPTAGRGSTGSTSAGLSSRRELRRRIVEPVGSACTLVAEQILQRKPEVMDRQLAALLVASVLLDTVNLDPDAGRTTEKDRAMVGLLIRAGSVDIAGLYEELVRARSDVGMLSSAQLLARDFKESRAGAVRFGMSSVPLLLDSWQRREVRFGQAVSGFMAEKELDLMVLLLFGDEKKFRRQLVICAADENLLNDVIARLEEPLGLVEISPTTIDAAGPAGARSAGVGGTVIRCFCQMQTAHSRKRIEPRLREILESL